MGELFDVICAGGAAASAARALERHGLIVGLASPASATMFVRGGADQTPREEREAIEHEPVNVPEHWSATVVLLSGLSPVVAHNAALCRAARAARRAGSVVVVDLNVRWKLWVGRDPRTVRMVLREADIVWASDEDMFGLDMGPDALRAALRDGARLATSDGPLDAIGICADLARAPHASHALLT